MIRLPQTTRPLKMALAVAVFAGALASCASPSTKGTERQKGYGKLAECIKPGMYRRQLYAVLPPMEKPMAFPVGPMSPSLTYPSFDKEKHRLDPEHYLEVIYYASGSPRRKPLPPLSSSKGLVPDSLDELIAGTSGRPNKPFPSKEKLSDVISEISKVKYEPRLLPPTPISRRAHPLPR